MNAGYRAGRKFPANMGKMREGRREKGDERMEREDR